MPDLHARFARLVAVAPCAFTLSAEAAGSNTVQVQVTPAGSFLPRDGREMSVPSWRIDDAIAARVIAAFKANRTPLVVDYEHQTLKTEENGQPAPAAGFFRELEWRPGEGLYATVELTERARSHVAQGEYLYFSPVFAYDKTGAVTRLLMGALTNNPALDGMQPLELRAAARFSIVNEEPAMKNALLAAICAALALPEDTSEDAAIAALDQVKASRDTLAALRGELGVAEDADTSAFVASCTALKERAAAAAEPDPAKFVPVAVVEELRTDIAALRSQQVDREVTELVETGLEEGRLLAAQKAWATDLGKKDLAALKSYLETSEPIAALRQTQTRGKAPIGQADENGLSEEERAVCSATGIDPKAYAAQKSAAA